jgi:hypothetical protein
MFPGAYFAEAYYVGYYWPPILAGAPVGDWVIFITIDE